MVQEELAGSEEVGTELKQGRRGQIIKLRNEGWIQEGGESQAHPYVPICKFIEILDSREYDWFFSSSFFPPMRRLDVDKPGCG